MTFNMSNWIQEIINKKQIADRRKQAFQDRIREINIAFAEIRKELMDADIGNTNPSRNTNEWEVKIYSNVITISERDISQVQKAGTQERSIKDAIISIILDKCIIE